MISFTLGLIIGFIAVIIAPFVLLGLGIQTALGFVGTLAVFFFDIIIGGAILYTLFIYGAYFGTMLFYQTRDSLGKESEPQTGLGVWEGLKIISMPAFVTFCGIAVYWVFFHRFTGYVHGLWITEATIVAIGILLTAITELWGKSLAKKHGSAVKQTASTSHSHASKPDDIEYVDIH